MVSTLILGAINPKTQKPDFACGKIFLMDGYGDMCMIHSGFLKKINIGDEVKWTCCSGYEKAEPCSSGFHACA